MDERRIEPRIGISFPVECDLAGKKSFFYTVSKDLSENGVKILTDDFLVKGENFKVNINLIDKIIRVKAEVMWCNKERLAERFSAGLRFVDVPSTSKRTITDFLCQVYQ
ncbi:MAG: PilZ domain-containing protein [Candidatus Omnitrophica bacterium]|jgi:c-di-GMP-binding flagellar brake protein YcgR|nr:PilZ domain-containing protein [Candidatus Omnitrophota bacterium]MDD5080979.1 PilZ domain-containing protein [Candidatus Omnitrophota bacterium]MDD5441226.1 PilZ domain-containing protein [Candidatus Omnitrophota bacterium]